MIGWWAQVQRNTSRRRTENPAGHSSRVGKGGRDDEIRLVTEGAASQGLTGPGSGSRVDKAKVEAVMASRRESTAERHQEVKGIYSVL